MTAQPMRTTDRNTKPYRDLLIDRELDVAQMDRLNAIPGIDIGSTCAGHPKERCARWPHFGFTVCSDGPAAEVVAERIARAIRSRDSVVETAYWRGFGEVVELAPGFALRDDLVTHVNGRLRKFKPGEFAWLGLTHVKFEKYVRCRTVSACVYVSSRIANIGTNAAALYVWWETAIGKLERAVERAT